MAPGEEKEDIEEEFGHGAGEEERERGKREGGVNDNFLFFLSLSCRI